MYVVKRNELESEGNDFELFVHTSLQMKASKINSTWNQFIFLDITSQEGTYPCDSCGKVYRQARNLWRHRRLKCGLPPSLVKFYCNQCNKTYAREYNFRQHQKECGKEPGFSCILCNYRSHHEYDLKKHMLSTHPGTFLSPS